MAAHPAVEEAVVVGVPDVFYGECAKAVVVLRDWHGLIVVSLGLQVLLAASILWPRIRGVSGAEWRRAMGWSRGQGFAREVGCGVLGYLAGLPLFLAGVVATLVLVAMWEGARFLVTGERQPAAPPNNPVMDLVFSGNILLIVLLVFMATVWAPIVVDSVFGGAMYRHRRGRTGIVAAGLLTAVVFAFMHGYGPLFTPPLMALGFVFAVLREWRGSIIAPMTAHFLHNATVLAIVITLVSVGVA